jgi:Zn finger protein HypA/HybF involved in hydrogenase expression
MKFKYFRLLIFFTLISLTSVADGFIIPNLSDQDSISFISPYAKENELCFKCHGQNKYAYTNENLGREVKALMFSERIIDRNKFYQSNHKNFKCTDCHSENYIKFPHAGELRMDQMYNCIDCHGGDEKFAKFKFEEIEAEYQKSVHFKMEDEGFTCWECHGPHDYKISARNSSNMKETILYDNNICLNCHSNYDRFQLLSDQKEVSLIKKHDWLPNQEAHIKNVRCIECHAAGNDTLLVSHLILPREKAVRKCNECHSKNSLLMASLYKFESKEQRRDGFFNGVILNESYVIGANRNQYLNILSLVIFGLIILIIAWHTYFRILKK